MQGTNAHLLLHDELEWTLSEAPALQWQRARYWHSPEPHALLHKALAASGSDVICAESSLSRPTAAFIFEHVVRDYLLLISLLP